MFLVMRGAFPSCFLRVRASTRSFQCRWFKQREEFVPKSEQRFRRDEPGVNKPPSVRSLTRPLLFTIGGSGVIFGGAAIWQYERMRSRISSTPLPSWQPEKRGELRRQIFHWWNSLSDGKKITAGIVAVNFMVFLLWRVPSLQRTMLALFTSSPAKAPLCMPMLLSVFSHRAGAHLAFNMLALWSFSGTGESLLGSEHYLAFLLSAGLVSSLASYAAKVAKATAGPSLGASGAIMALVGLVCWQYPDSRLALIFLPTFSFPASYALAGVMAFDTAGLLLGWRTFDHAAHLGGVLWGIWYANWGYSLIWRNREAFVTRWHELRTGRRKGGREP
uniref:presenilin-associated rhomboid-like protein, mitochondrial isoform X1 n=1 Tax=Myxine glutinosa TaxID=7769 RepID=UPI00358E16E6